MNTFLQDLRYGLRMLRRNPGFTAVTVIALALGIASSTAIFSIVDEVLLHPLPYPNPEQLLDVSQSERSTGAWKTDASPANYVDWVAQNHVFSEMAAARGWQANLSGSDRPERIRTTMVTASFFRLFGVGPMLGRTFVGDDEKPGSAQVAVLSQALWQRRYAADPAILGRDIILDGDRYTVVGVMPQRFSPDNYGELWVPSPWAVPNNRLRRNEDPRQLRDSNYLDVWARLKTDVTLQQAAAEMDAIGRQLEQEYPNANMDNGIRLRPMQEELVREIRPVLLVLTAAVAFVLLIGCANVANLLLTRASTRAKEISIRAALGASRWRLIRQLLTESVLLSFLGGALGLFLAVWSVPILLTFSPAELRDVHGIILNREVLSFSILASMLTGILFGLVPAIYASRANFSEALRDADRGSTLGRIRGRGILIAGEVAVSIILLIGAGLMLKSFAKLTHVDPGFNADRLLVFNIGYPPSADVARQTAFYQQVIERLRALPGVTAAGAVSRLPLSGGNSTRSFNLPGSDKNHDADIRVSTPDYLATMGIPLLKGRNLNEHDTSGTPLVAVINEIGARNVFGGADPLGKYITNFGPKNEKLQIVGVVGNVRHVGLEAQPRAEIYQPSGQAQWPSMFVAVRTATSNPRALISAVQNAVWSVDDNVPLANLRTMRDMIAASVVRQKFAMLLLAIFAGLAVCLAAIGLYGVMSYSVSQRTREIGIRVALGARRGDVLRLVIGQGMLFAAIGVAAGVLVSLGMARLIANLLFAVSPTDSATFAGVATLLSLVALLACWLPARRASTVDPMVALREA